MVVRERAPVSAEVRRNAWGEAKANALRWADMAEAVLTSNHDAPAYWEALGGVRDNLGEASLGGEDIARTCVEMAKVWAAVAEAHRPQA